MMRKLFSVLTAALLVLALAACSDTGPTPEDAVNGFMDAWKRLDTAKAQEYLLEDDLTIGDEKDSISIDDFGDGQEDVPAWMLEFIQDNMGTVSYEITSAKTEGVTAELVMDTSYPDAGPVVGEILSEYVLESLGLVFGGEEPSDEEMQALLEEIAREKFTDAQLDTKDATITVNLVKTEGKWLIRAIEDDFLDVLSMGLASELDDLAEQFADD